MTNLVFPLVSKILSLLVLVGAGVVLVKTKLLKKEDSIALSKISVFLLSPCVIVSSFSMKVDGKAGQSLLLCFFYAILANFLFLFLGTLLRKPLHLSPVEEMSMEYTNCGSFVLHEGFAPGTDFPFHLGFRENDWADQYAYYRYRFGQYVFQKDFILSKNLYGYGFPTAFLPFYLPFADFCAQQDRRLSGQSRPFPRDLFKCHGSGGRERFPVCHPLWKRRGVCKLYQHFHDPLYYHFHADSGVS